MGWNVTIDSWALPVINWVGAWAWNFIGSTDQSLAPNDITGALIGNVLVSSLSYMRKWSRDIHLYICQWTGLKLGVLQFTVSAFKLKSSTEWHCKERAFHCAEP